MNASDQPVALITGGANGIGLGVARRLLHEGWRVAVVDADSEAVTALPHTLGHRAGRLAPIHGDVADEASVRDAAGEVMNRFGRMDGLVNNAAIADAFTGPVEALALEEWNRRLAVNLTGAFLLVKHTAGHLAAHHGAIVNIASTRALQSEPDSEAYAASKGGLVALTHALAVSLSGRVRVNAVSPGWISEDSDLAPQDHAQHPAGRVGRPEDVAGLCAFLLSDAAGFITGENIVADGGMSRRMMYAE